MEIYTGLTTRKTICAICHEQIDYGTPRTVVVIGGMVSRRAHPDCIRRGLKILKGYHKGT